MSSVEKAIKAERSTASGVAATVTSEEPSADMSTDIRVAKWGAELPSSWHVEETRSSQRADPSARTMYHRIDTLQNPRCVFENPAPRCDLGIAEQNAVTSEVSTHFLASSHAANSTNCIAGGRGVLAAPIVYEPVCL
jgi:hypothetical protein